MKSKINILDKEYILNISTSKFLFRKRKTCIKVLSKLKKPLEETGNLLEINEIIRNR